MSTEERLEKLERDLARAKRGNRRMVLAGAGLLLGLFALLVVARSTTSVARGQEKPADKTVIRANEFVLVDDQGRERGKLATVLGSPTLALFDENGNTRAQLRSDTGASSLFLWGASGSKAGARLTVIKGSGASLILDDENGCTRASLDLLADIAELSLSDEKGKSRVLLGVNCLLGVMNKGPMLVLYDEKGKARAQLGTAQTRTADGETTLYPESSLLLFSPDGKVRWSAP